MDRIYGINEALAELGVTDDTLTEDERRSLDEQGYVVLPAVMDNGMIEGLRERYEDLMRQEGQSAGMEVHQEAGTRRLADLVNKGAIFDAMYTNPKVLAAVYHALRRPFKLSSLNARDAMPGEGQQHLHADWNGPIAEGEPFHVVNSIWLVDDFTPDNGATRIVPGSHRWRGTPRDALGDPLLPHPEERLLVAPAGTVVVFNSHTWHGGTINRTGKPRRACHVYFTAREHEQQLNQREYIRKSTYDRLSPAARYILDVE